MTAYTVAIEAAHQDNGNAPPGPYRVILVRLAGHAGLHGYVMHDPEGNEFCIAKD